MNLFIFIFTLYFVYLVIIVKAHQAVEMHHMRTYITTSFITKIKVKLNLQHKYINTKRGNIYSE